MLIANSLLAGNFILKGEVLDASNQSPLIGVLLHWENTEKSTSTNLEGKFELRKSLSSDILVVDYTGFSSKRIKIQDEENIVIQLNSNENLEIVEIKVEKPSTRIDFYSTIKVEEISEKGISKAACCNLSESFETNPTVDAFFTDAITGTKQIQLLGLAGPYSLLTSGNIPSATGNSALSGLDFIPGQWLSSIQIIKGTGSVVNGNQSIAGQINTEFKDLIKGDKVFINLYANNQTRTELNYIQNFEVTKNIHSGLFIQADNGLEAIDNNGDKFMDNQLGPKIVAMNKWEFKSDSLIYTIKGGVKFELSEKESGQLPSVLNRYIFRNQQEKIEGWAKIGFIFNKTGRSSGVQLSAFTDDKKFQFGNKTLSGEEDQLYINWIYADIIKNSNHSIKSGINYVYNNLKNNYNELGYAWNNNIIGFFNEYSFKPTNKFSLIGGLRYDYSLRWGGVLTPRIHGRIEIIENNVLRFSGGLGTKSPNPFFENIGIFASSREVKISSNLTQEQAWNYGFNFSHKSKLFNRPITVSTDFYRTDFLNKLVANYDLSANEILFYNLSNGSYANSLMVQIITKPIKMIEITTAYRYYDVQTKFNGTSYQRNPLTPANRAFLNSDIALGKKWNWDLTISWNGQSRIPSTSDKPVEFQLNPTSNDFWLFNSQVKFSSSKRWDFYLGTENLFNFQQTKPIIDAQKPFGSNFDASLIWGPVFGRKVYFGMKFKLI